MKPTMCRDEVNVFEALASYGLDARFVSMLPKKRQQRERNDGIVQVGAHVGQIIRSGDRVGIYFLQTRSNCRSSQDVYDRANSSICNAIADGFDYQSLITADLFLDAMS